MALSSLSFTSRGAGPYPLAGLDYLSTAHLQARVNGTPVTATFDAQANTCTLATPAAAGTTVTIVRTTPRKREERLTQYLSLPSGQAGLTAQLLDQDYRQNMLVMGEGRDIADALVADTTKMGLNAAGQWDGRSKKIQAVAAGQSPGPGVTASDLINKSQLDAVAAGAILLPTTVLDENDGLMVVAGAWDDQAPASFRSALQLGTAALQTAGIGANNVPPFDAFARYQAADGRNIDLTSHAVHSVISQRALATVAQWKIAGGGPTSPGVDPSSAGWSQNSATRVNLGSGWGARVELNNGGGDIDGSSISPYRVRLTAGTWRIRWVIGINMPGSGSTTNKTSIRITNNDDTSSQLVYFDLGLHRPHTDFSGRDIHVFGGTLLLTLASPDGVVFRWSNLHTGGANVIEHYSVLFHKVRA